MRRPLTAALLSAGLATAGLLAAPAAEAVDTSTTARQTFADDAGGWTPSTASTGLCVPMVTCAVATSAYSGTGGSDGVADGYLSTTFTGLANALASTTSTWTSPAFAYDGVAGQVPTAVTFDLARKATVGTALGLDVLNDSTFRVDLVDAETGMVVEVKRPEPLAGATEWTAVATADVSPARLSIGHSYRVRITTTYGSTVTVVPDASVGYDDVRLTATRSTTGQTPEVIIVPGPETQVPTPYPVETVRTVTVTAPATPAAKRTGLKSNRQLRRYVEQQGLPGQVRVVGRSVRVKLSCLPLAAPKPCVFRRLQVVSTQAPRPVVTAVRPPVRVSAGTSKVVRLKLRRSVAGTHVVLRGNVRVAAFKVQVSKRAKLHRGTR
jgi:hypothetical protein